jgi:hypothetical protein
MQSAGIITDCDSLGRFEILLNNQDSIIITSVGYRHLTIHSSFLKNKNIFLEPVFV